MTASPPSRALAPRNRPPLSVPKKAINVVIAIAMVLPFVLSNILGLVDLMIGSRISLLDQHLLLFIAAVGGWVLVLLFVVRSGRVIGLHLLRGTAALDGFCFLAGLVMAGALTFGFAADGSRHARLTGEFGIIMSAVVLPFLWFGLRGLRRVRWLDPQSSPEEWEPPVRQSKISSKA